MVRDTEEMINNGDKVVNIGGTTEVFVEELPSSVIVSNLTLQLFDDENERVLFESVFQDIDCAAMFHYFKSFRRARINFSSSNLAAKAKNQLHLTEFRGQILKCYFTQPVTIGTSPHLQPPKREKQFLISPPASPPVGWAPSDEAKPIIDYDLLSAIASLAPGEAHELHPASKDQPAIVVHVSEEENGLQKGGLIIPQTRCPIRQ